MEGFLIQCRYSNIHKDKNNHAKILKEISDINFSKLKMLTLRSNRIESVEGMSRIRLPNLRNLQISIIQQIVDYNMISSFRDMRKANYEKLSILGISKTSSIKTIIE